MNTTPEFEEALKGLNKEQKRAVEVVEGPVLVVAGPGSGKTQILSLRVGNILMKTDTAPSSILCLTFTDSASINMRERLSSLIGRDAYRVAIHTFHSFCNDVIGAYPEYFYNSATFVSADELKQMAVMEGILESLPHDDPMRSKHSEQGYVYLKPALKDIETLKKAGITPDVFTEILEANKVALEKINPLIEKYLSARLSKKSFGDIETLLGELEKLDVPELPGEIYETLPRTVHASLSKAFEEAQEEDSTKPLSRWKQRFTKKDENKKIVFKDTLALEKLESLQKVYEAYRDKMYNAGFYDFGDMLLDVIDALEKQPELRYELQERYQYILVDEFQDTNNAQMKIVQLIGDADVNEGRPNVMAVGDDDQAVYRFQGAEISNILDFKKMYRDPEIVTLVKNYRSTQEILDAARGVIVQGEERLENQLDEIEKNLVASNPEMEKGDIVNRVFDTDAHEYHWVAGEIARLIEEGKDPKEIAVISRKHDKLEKIVPYLVSKGVTITYERRQNVFHEEHIAQLILMARFLDAMYEERQKDADEYLPTILAFPFWELDRKVVWDISTKAYKEEKLWLEVMQEHENEQVRKIADFFMQVALEAKYRPLEQIVDMFVGAHVPLVNEGEEEEKSGKFFSPFKSYYFSKEKFTHDRSTYLQFLSGLRVFVQAIREYRQGEILKLHDLVEFVDLYENNNLKLNDVSPFSSAGSAVHLMTAHKAKGLEFDTVFVLSCQQSVWAGRGMSDKISFPANLTIRPASDTLDDKLRLFYVALTRAKRHLYLTGYTYDESGKESTRLEFLVGQSTLPEIQLGDKNDVPDIHDVLTSSWLQFHAPEFSGDEEVLLKSLLSDYQMSVTHLNNFLDLVHGGPQKFLENNLLRFPKAKSASLAYGSAVHKTLELVYLHLKNKGETPSVDAALGWFEKELYRGRLSKQEFELELARGKGELAVFLEQKMKNFEPDHVVEANFKHQGVVVGDAHLTGKIDKIITSPEGTAEVYDYKTGRIYDSWEKGDASKKVRLRELERQQVFYRLLMNESRDYAKYEVTKGTLEFIKSRNGELVELSSELTDEKVEHLRALIQAVYTKIMNVDFPDVSEYSQDLKGVERFEQDLIEGNI